MTNGADDDDLQKKTKAKRSIPASIASSLAEININRGATSITSSLAASHQLDRRAGPASSSTHKSLFSQRGIFHSTHVSLLMDSSKDALISGSQVLHPRGDALRSSSSGFLSKSPPLASNIRAAAPGWSSTDRGCLVKDASGSKSTMAAAAAAAAKRVSFQLDEATRDGPIRGQASKAAARQGSRFCGFLASACRECQAFDPTKHVLSSSRNNSNRHNSSRMARTF